MTTPETTRRFAEDIGYARALVERTIDDADELATVLDQIYHAIFGVDPSKYDVSQVRASAEDRIRDLFLLRLEIRDQIGDWHKRGFINARTETNIRNVFRALRYATDMLGELQLHQPDAAPRAITQQNGLAGFTGGSINTLVNPGVQPQGGDVTFRSGDVLLMRGGAHNSAAIARIGDNDTQFSHVGMIYVDEKGTPWVVEALIEDGSVINELDHVLNHGVARLVLFRPKDAKLGEAAAKEIHKYISATLAPGGKRILYDFTMQLEETGTLFCSKLVRLAYNKASVGKLDLPTFPTGFNMKNRDFLDRIGVKARTTFAPGDMELEPNFDLVAEWRDYRVTSRLRLQDLLMDKLFEWMETHGYKFRETMLVRAISLLGRLSARLSNDAKEMIEEVVPKVPENMSRRTIAAVAMLHKTAEPILEHLQALERHSLKAHGYPLHPRHVRLALEAYREKCGREIGYLVRRG